MDTKHERRKDSGGPVRERSSAEPQLAPGKRTLTEALAPAQGREVPGGEAPRGVATTPTAHGVDPIARERMLSLFGDPREAPQAGAAGLPEPVRGSMERSFGADFSGVRVHESSPEASAQGALAVARGRDLHFAPGQYDPGSSTGRELIGHELAHVVQQAQGRAAATHQRKGGQVSSDPALEAEADRLGTGAARGEIVAASGVTAANAPAGIAQMKIGVELQSTWRILRIGTRTNPDSKDVVYRGVHFQIEVDKGDRHAELEIVTDPLANRDEVDGCIAELRHVVGQLSTRKGKTFKIGPGDGWLEETEIQRDGEAPTFRMQYTEGVTMENIPSLIRQFHPHAWRDMPDAVKKDGARMEMEKTGKVEKKDDETTMEVEKTGTEKKSKKREIRHGKDEQQEPESSKLQGLITAICMYLGDVARWSPKKPDDDVKYALPLMARTDFYAMYHRLEADERIRFRSLFDHDKAEFHGYALDARVFGALGDDEDNKDKKVDLTRRQWLQSMVDGRPKERAVSKAKLVRSEGNDPKDLMSPPPWLNSHGTVDDWNEKHRKDPQMKHAMGMYELDHGELALFEARTFPTMGEDLARSLTRLDGLFKNTAARDPKFAANDRDEGRSNRTRHSKSEAAPDNPLGDRTDPPGVHYMPTEAQVNRMILHRRRIDWVAPDGFCMLGAVARVAGIPDAATLRSQILTELHDPGSPASRYINHYDGEHEVADVRNVLEKLEDEWSSPAANIVLPVAALVAGVGVTVLEPEGTAIPVNGGGTILLHVRSPHSHYHSTEPA